MKKIKQIFLAILIIVASRSYSQTNNSIIEEKPYIEVTGTAEKEIVPDEIYIDIVIREKIEKQIKISVEEQEIKLKESMKLIGLEASNLYLSDANADYVKVRWQKRDVLTKKEYTLKVTNATSVGKVFQELEKLEITNASISKVDHSKMDSLKKEVKIMSIKAAKEKADYLLMAIGELAGKPLIIKETNEAIARGQIESVNIRGARSENEYDFINGDKLDRQIQFEKIKIRANIYVKFLIK
jgi:uncharacterized protein